MSKAPHHVLLDNDFLADPKIQIVIAELGPVAVAYYVHLLTRLNSECGTMPRKHVDVLGAMLGVDKASWMAFVDLCIAEDLVSQDDGYVFKNRLVKDAADLAEKQRVWRENKKKKVGFSKDSIENPVRVSSHVKEYEHEQEKEHENEREQEPEKEDPPDYSGMSELDQKKMAVVESHLEPTNKPEVLKSHKFVNMGQRPMRKYPDIWIAPLELKDVLETFEAHRLPTTSFAGVFKRVNSSIKEKRANGDHGAGKISAYKWLTSWALKDELDLAKAAKDHERSATYLDKSKER